MPSHFHTTAPEKRREKRQILSHPHLAPERLVNPDGICHQSSDTDFEYWRQRYMMDYKLHHSLGYKLSLAARVQERRLDESMKTLGLTRTTWCVLLAVGVEGHEQPSDIAEFIGIDRTATSRALRTMEESGLVTRKAGKGDRRTTQVALTQEGIRLIGQGIPFAQDNNAALQSRLSPAEHEHLHALLSKLTEGERPALKSF